MSGKLTTGSGNHRFEVVHNWLQPPDGLKFGNTHGVTVDSQGNIYIAHTVHAESKSHDAIVVYDKNGKFLRSFGTMFRGFAHGLNIHVDGHGEECLYHAAQELGLWKTTLDGGEIVWNLSVPRRSGRYRTTEQRFKSTNVAFGNDGVIYLADGYGQNCVHVLLDEVTSVVYQSTIGKLGNGEGELREPHGLWVDRRGTEPLLLVADRGNNRVQQFDLDGEHVGFLRHDFIRRPCHFDIQGELLLITDLDSTVTLWDRQNNFIAALCDGKGLPTVRLRMDPISTEHDGKFICPHDACFLPDGSILVVEWVEYGRITLLKKI